MLEEIPTLNVLLHESDQVAERVSKIAGVVYTLYGVILPIISGAVLLAASNDEKRIPLELLAVALAGVVSLSIMYSSSLSIEVLHLVHYKSVELYPRIYSLVGRASWTNYVHFVCTKQREMKTMSLLPTLLFMITTFLVTGVISVFLIIAGTDQSPELRFGLIAVVLLFFSAAAISVFCVIGVATRYTMI